MFNCGGWSIARGGRCYLTLVMHDGLGRVAYMAKEGEVAQDNNSTATKKGWNISGTVYYDNEGKKVLEGQPVFYSGNLIAELDKDRESQVLVYKKFNNLQNPTGFIYDGIGRNIKTILPDENIQTSEYGIKNNFSIIKTTDPLGNKSVTKKDVHGNIREVERLDKDENLLTKARYEYSLLGEMLKAYDAKGNIISVNYDLLGRRISLESLDMGRKEWNYDAKGLLASETDSVLRAKQAAIKYEYDELDRIVKIDYPFSIDTCYEYGKAGEAGAGKIVHKTDETGETFYRYGKLNEVTEETRTIKRGRDGVQKPITSSFSYEVDYLGRMQTITYPDGEVVRYTYDAGGQLNGVSGKKAGTEYRYVDSILYNEQGQRVYIRYGNGVETRYKYDPARRWLDSIKTVNKDKNLSFQNIKYNFDAVGNVKGYENTASTYATSQSYTYDNLYQLVKAEGTTKAYAGVNPVPENPGSVLSTNKYRQTFGFDDIGNMMSKVSTTNIAGGSSAGKNDAALNYNLDYEYDPSYAHRLIRAGERYYKYDANGNLIAEKDGAFEAEDDFTFKYSYFEDLDVYGVDYGFDLAPPQKDPANLADKGTQAGKKSGYRRDYEWNERNLLSRSRDSEKTVTYRYGEDGQRALKFCLQTNSETLYFNNFYSMQQVAHEPNHEQGLRVSKHIFVGNSRLVTALTHQAGIDTTEQAAKLYYYHADHLQSAQFITDANGEKYEHIEYTPYGELWIEETAPGVDKLPFRFTGKELDTETGLYYYGARYLDPKYSRFMSCDPIIFGLNIYSYGGNNPIKYVDPNGMWDDKNEWNPEFQKKYEDYIPLKIFEYEKNKKRFTCEDLALSILIDFASENSLPLNIKNNSGTYNSSDNKYSDPEKYKKDVLSSTAANDLMQNTVAVDKNNISSGDLILMDTGTPNGTKDNEMSHTQVVTKNENGVLTIKQGNFSNGSSKYGSLFYGGKMISERTLDTNRDVFKGAGNNEVPNASNVFGINYRRWNFGAWKK